MIQFFRGLRANYVANPNHKDGIYFATDTGELLVNGMPYGTSLFFDKETNTLKVNYVTYDEEGNPTLQHGEGMKALNELISVATSSQAGLMSAEAVEQLSAIYAEFEAGTLGGVLGVVEGEKIISVDAETKLLSSTLNFNNTLVEKEGKKYLQLLGIDNAVVSEFDVTEFIMDGVLDDVEIVEATTENQINGQTSGKFVEFTWNTGKKDYIAVADLAKTYTAGEGIAISATNEISVSEVDGDKVSVDAIPVGGTPLADILTAKGINTISAGNLQAVLEALFSKEDWPTNPTRSFTNPSVSQSKPTITLSKTTAIVGETITVTASAATASGSGKASYSGFTYGYSSANDNTKDGDTPSTVTKNIARTSGNYTLAPSITAGFSGQEIPAANVTESATAASLSSTSLVVNKGTNTVQVVTGTPKFSVTIPASEMPIYYACSTLKKTSPDHVVAAATEDKVWENLSKSNVSNTASVTGVYPIYTNATWIMNPTKDNAADKQSNANTAWDYKGGVTNSSTDAKLSTLTNGTSTFYAFVAFDNGFVIKLPSGWKVEAAQTKSDTVGGVFDGNQAIPTATTEEITVAGTVKDTYNVYTFDIKVPNNIRLKISTIG